MKTTASLPTSKVKSPEGYWDGTDQHGRRCAQGTYVYVIRYRNSLDPLSTQELKGTITLIR